MRRLYIIFIKRNTFILDRLKQLILFFVLINTQLSSSQQTLALDESVFVHANATTFVTGETLLFKVYCLKSSDKTPSIISKIAYIELVDSSKKSVFKTKIALKNTTGQGDFFIPTTLKTGSYKLIGYTNWMLNKPLSEFFQIDITIINPFKIIEKTSNEKNGYIENKILLSNKTVSHTNKNTLTNPNVQFNLPKKTLSHRELVNLQIKSENKLFNNGNYSLSVRKIDDLTTTSQITGEEFAKLSNKITFLQTQNQADKIYLPELRGEIISGKITSKDNTDNLKNKAVALSIPGKYFTFKIAQTDGQGNFIFNLHNIYNTSNITVQIVDEKANNYSLTLYNNPNINYSELSLNEHPNLSFSKKEILLNRSISTQIENAYFYKKTDSLVNQVEINPFYNSFEKEYILDDYTRFKTLKETITEVATDIYIKQLNGNYYLHVIDPNVFPQLPKSALVLIDGLLLQNQNDLINYNMNNIFKIDLIAGRYYVGAQSFNGLICFTTFDKDFKSNQNESSIIKASILRPQPKKAYYTIDYSNLSQNERIPDYRYQLLWLPQLTLAGNENLISFYTSDVSGTFEISLEGFTDQGIPVSLKDTFEVQ